MKVHNLLKLLCLTLLLSGCGQMGPLYLPGTAPPIHVEKEKPDLPDEAEKTESEKSTPPQNQ